MAAPVWTPEEEGGLLSDEEAEAQILARFLFAEPPRLDAAGGRQGTRLEEEAPALTATLRLLSGAEVTLGAADLSTTDGQMIFLPEALPEPIQAEADARLYRWMGLVQLGLLDLGLARNRALLSELHRDWVFRGCWHVLALHVVLADWCRRWPGLGRDRARLFGDPRAAVLRVGSQPVSPGALPPALRPLYVGLGGPPAMRSPVEEAAATAIRAVSVAQSLPAASLIVLGAAQSLREALRGLRAGPPPVPAIGGALRPEWILHDLRADLVAAEAWKQGPAPLRLLRAALGRAGLAKTEAPPPPPASPPLPTAEAGHRWPEWELERSAYRSKATRVVEVELPAGSPSRWERSLAAQEAELQQIRRRFAALRPEPRWESAASEGTDLDLNRLVAAAVDLKAGHSPRPDWFLRFHRRRQPLAILTLIDTSGSTLGGTLSQELDAIVLLSEGLDALAWPYALYTFASQGPERCELGRLKGFEERTDATVHRRLGGLRAAGATRTGAFLREAGHRLAQRPEAGRLLLVLTDGKPHCSEGYTEERALADAALARLEQERRGIGVYGVCLSGHEGSASWMHRLFGPHRSLLLRSPEELPERLPALLLRLLR